jgi:hypothetical protein
MEHLHKRTNTTYEVGTASDFDMTIITKWPDYNSIDDDDDITGPVIIDYYFGEYDPEATDYYIDRYLQKQESLAEALELFKHRDQWSNQSVDELYNVIKELYND